MGNNQKADGGAPERSTVFRINALYLVGKIWEFRFSKVLDPGASGPKRKFEIKIRRVVARVLA